MAIQDLTIALNGDLRFRHQVDILQLTSKATFKFNPVFSADLCFPKTLFILHKISFRFQDRFQDRKHDLYLSLQDSYGFLLLTYLSKQ